MWRHGPKHAALRQCLGDLWVRKWPWSRGVAATRPEPKAGCQRHLRGCHGLYQTSGQPQRLRRRACRRARRVLGWCWREGRRRRATARRRAPRSAARRPRRLGPRRPPRRPWRRARVQELRPRQPRRAAWTPRRAARRASRQPCDSPAHHPALRCRAAPKLVAPTTRRRSRAPAGAARGPVELRGSRRFALRASPAARLALARAPAALAAAPRRRAPAGAARGPVELRGSRRFAIRATPLDWRSHELRPRWPRRRGAGARRAARRGRFAPGQPEPHLPIEPPPACRPGAARPG